MTYIDDIKRLGACQDALAWLRDSRHPTLAAAWAACPRGDWMLWLAGRCAGPVGDPRRVPLALAAAGCAELVLPHVVVGEDRPREAIETLRAWARDEATIVQVRAAADAAGAAGAAGAAAWGAGAAWAAWAAESAARAAVSAGGASEAATGAAADAADAADAAGAARTEMLAQCADIVRRHYPEPPVLPVLPA